MIGEQDVTARMYASTTDLDRMRRMTAQVAHRYGDCGLLHVGDISHRIFNVIRCRPPQEIVRLWENQDGQLLAWVIVYGRFRAFDWLVHPSLHGSALETDVLAWAEAHTAREYAMAQKRVDYGNGVFDGDTRIIELLTARGYRPELDRNTPNLLTTRLLENAIPEPVLPAGFAIRTVLAQTESVAARQIEATKLAEVHNSAFSSVWTAESYGAYMRSPGYAQGTELVVEAPDDRLAAFCVYWLDPITRTGLFEPVGAHEDFRRRGLTKALLFAGLRRMQAAGMEAAFVQHERGNLAASALYRSVGFRNKYLIRWFMLPEET